MTKNAELLKLSSQTPVRRVGLSRLSKNHSVNVLNRVVNTSSENSPAKMGNIGTKIIGGVHSSPMKSESKENELTNSSGKKFDHKSQWNLKTSKSDESSPAKLGSGRKVGLSSPWKQSQVGEGTPVKLGSVKRKIEMESPEYILKKFLSDVEAKKEEEETRDGMALTNKCVQKSPWKYTNDQSEASPPNMGTPTPRKVGLKSPSKPTATASALDTVINLDSSVYSGSSEKVEVKKEIDDDPVVIVMETGSNEDASESESSHHEKENSKAVRDSTPPPLFRPLSRPFSQSSNIHEDLKTFPEAAVPSKKLKKKYRLSLTLTPDRLQELRKRKFDLSRDNNSPKTESKPFPSKLKIIDLTQDSEDEDEADQSPVLVPVPVALESVKKETATPVTPEKPVVNHANHDKLVAKLKSEVEEKRQKLAAHKAMKESNEQTKRLIKRWTEGGIRALEELSATRTPPIEIGLILNELQIPHEMYGYDASMGSFDPKYP